VVTGEAAWLDSLALEAVDSLADSVPAEDELLDTSEPVDGVLVVETVGVLAVVVAAFVLVVAGALAVVVAAFVESAGSCPAASWT
jgi:small-conductance mechanosensitive channel